MKQLHSSPGRTSPYRHRRYRKSLRRAGRLVLAHARSSLSRIIVDRWYRIDTAGVIGKEELGIVHPESVHYEASSWWTLRRALPKSAVTSGDVFLDLGSGKGRVILQAAQYPFSRVIGVEISRDLNDIARHNLETSRKPLQASVEILTADVAEYTIPHDATVIYLYNPFTGSLFRTVIDGILRSVDEHPRSVTLICRTPWEEAYLLDTGRFRVVKTVHALRPTRKWRTLGSTRVYEVLPSLPKTDFEDAGARSDE